MTTIVASPPTLTTLPRLGWDGDQSGFTQLSMSNDDVSRLFMPPRKVVTRSASSSSLASTASTSSTSTVISATDPPPSSSSSSTSASSSASSSSAPSVASSTSSAPATPNGDSAIPSKKKQRGGFWPVSKAESTSSVTNTRANGAVQPAATNGMTALSQKSAAAPVLSDQSATQLNGAVNRIQTPALLVLSPINGTFERKQINVPVQPDPPLKIGRQTNNKTTPKQDNGYFDSKVLSRQHAEISADAQGRVFIKDVKSSNGTFVNGERLSPENRESELRELRPEDSLELGIDIVSEDQKTIVHHKVSAKVDFAGFPGKAGNAMDNILNFGDLQGSQNGVLGSTPMAHQRSQQARGLNGRGSISSNATNGAMANMSYRQANYYGPALNIEQLVKHVATEMRAAKQQALDLDQTKSYLTSLVPADGSPSKLNPPPQIKEPRANARHKATRVDHSARFLDPPAPPPQQPLPEKPDSAKAGLKREQTAKPLLNGMTTSPTGGQQSQILALINDLKEAQKQIESQSSRVKELEDALKRERLARESAEAQVRKLAVMDAAKPIVEQPDQQPKESTEVSQPRPAELEQTDVTDAVHAELQQRLDFALQEMQSMKMSLEQTSKRADTAEAERASFASMIEKYRQEKEKAEAIELQTDDDPAEEIPQSPERASPSSTNLKHSRPANGHTIGPQISDGLHQAVSTMLQQQQMSQNPDVPPQYAPYVSMMGVVLIGVGIMAYLNSWQKVDK